MNNSLVIILNWNGKNDTLELLKSLDLAGFSRGSTLVVDNGSTDDSTKAIRQEFPDINLIETGKNLGFAEGNNIGIRWGLEKGYQGFLLLNNDTLVAPDLMQQLSLAVKQFPAVGIFGAKIHLQSDPTRLDHLGGNWNQKKAQMDLIGMRAKSTKYDEPLELDYVCGAAMLIRREVFEKIGLLDPRFFLYWEESDLCCRAKRAGFKVLSFPRAKIWHKVSASIDKGGKPFKIYFYWRNYLLWMERNLPIKKRVLPFIRISRSLIKDFIHLQVRRLKLPMLRHLSPHSAADLETRMLQQKAKCTGVKDYFIRHFGEGSSAAFTKKV